MLEINTKNLAAPLILDQAVADRIAHYDSLPEDSPVFDLISKEVILNSFNEIHEEIKKTVFADPETIAGKRSFGLKSKNPHAKTLVFKGLFDWLEGLGNESHAIYHWGKALMMELSPEMAEKLN